MPLQNRVTPLGELIADPARGLVYGNRGCLHDGTGRIRRHHSGRRWIACRLDFKGRRRSPLLQPGRYTELFFLDEATAFAAGHRPCAECRRADYNRFLEIVDAPGADAIDERLHAERFAHHRDDDLPDGAFVFHDGEPWLVLGAARLRWTPAGYAERAPRPSGPARVITPPSLLAVLRSGWDGAAVPLLHPTSQPAAGLAMDPEL
ncbi:MAG TPA: hypothetical protein VFM58_06960 [Solirubrobacteraceae bacterium]|nr:hypothetical protein [Solirubrobacteraceae bacterium]